MSAHKSGATAGRLRIKNGQMAANMKAAHIERKTMNCPMCHKLISMGSLFTHVGKGGCYA